MIKLPSVKFGSMKGRTLFYPLILFILIIRFSPITISAPAYWTVSPGWSFYSGTGATSGPVTFSSEFTTTQIDISGGLVTFSDFDMGTPWNSIGFSSPASATLEIQEVNVNTINVNATPTGGAKTFSVYVGNKGRPFTVTGSSSWAYSDITKIVSFDTAVSKLIVLSWVNVFTITLSTEVDEIEAGLYGLLVASCVDGNGTNYGNNVKFTIDGAPFRWNDYTKRYESRVRETTPTTNTYDTVDSLTDAVNPGSTASINQTASVTWITSLLSTVGVQMQTGDLIGALLTINTAMIGTLFFYTFLLTSVSMAIYNYQGAEGTLLSWILGWGMWSAVVQGSAVTIGLIMLSLGGGILILKLFLDRRTS